MAIFNLANSQSILKGIRKLHATAAPALYKYNDKSPKVTEPNQRGPDGKILPLTKGTRRTRKPRT